MSDVDVWRQAAGPLLEELGFTPEGAEPAASEAVEPVQTPDVPAAPPEQTAAVEPEQTFEFPELAPVPQDILDDLGDDDDPEPSAAVADDDDEYDDDTTRNLKAELRKAQRQLENERKQRVESNIGSWREKYKRMYPLADVGGITAQSRRQFEREAILSHNKNYTVLKPHIEAFNSARNQLKSETTAEAKAEVAAAWGSPTTGPGAGAAVDGARDAAIVKSRRDSKTLPEHIKNILALNDDQRTRR